MSLVSSDNDPVAAAPTTPPPTATPPTTPKSPLQAQVSFKSSLQVLLKKQEEELVKHIEYKEKLEQDEELEGGEKQTEKMNGSKERMGEERKSDEAAETQQKKKEKEGSKEKKDGESETKTKTEDTSEKTIKDPKKSQEKKDKRKKEEGSEGRDEREEKKEETKQDQNKDSEDDERRGEEKVEDKSKEPDRGKEKSVVAKEEKTEEKGEKCESEVKTNGTGKKVTETEEKKEAKNEVKQEKKDAAKGEKGTVKTKEVDKKAEEKRKKKEAVERRDAKEERRGEGEEKTQGVLLKRRKRPFVSWKRYYFVLDGSLLTYYRSHHDYERLSGMKGSLDLALLEDIRSKKPGLMRTHFPFCLARRNLGTVHLAAETKESRERWMAVLQGLLQGQNRLSSHSSDKALHSGTPFASCSPSTFPAKSATLPGTTCNADKRSSIVSFGEVEEGGGEEEEEEEEKEEEFIQPKKVPRVPIGVPLVKVNLGEVKLKNVEAFKGRNNSEEGNGEKKTADALVPGASDPTEKEESEEKSSAGEVFGVRLKKTQAKEAVGEGGRRPTKQPVIPLNNSGLLSRTEIQSPKVSPGTQKRITIERKKSPSPSLPISKSVQALTKSAEEVRATSTEEEEALTQDTTTKKTDTSEGKLKPDMSICYGQTNALKQSDSFEIMVPNEHSNLRATELDDDRRVVEAAKEKNGDIKEREETAKKEEEEEEKGKVAAQGEDSSSEIIPEITITLKGEEEEEEPQYEEFDENILTNSKDALVSVLPSEDTDGHESDEYEEFDENFFSRINEKNPDSLLSPATVSGAITPPNHSLSPSPSEAPGNPPPIPKTPSPCPPTGRPDPPSSLPQDKNSPDSDQHDYEEFDERFLENVKIAYKPPSSSTVFSEPGEAATAKDQFRIRSSTNESTASSTYTGEPESDKKKSNKFKIFKKKRVGKTASKDKTEDVDHVEAPKEKKRRGSNAFSKFLPGKKTKETSKKPAEDESKQEQAEVKGKQSSMVSVEASSSPSEPSPTSPVTPEVPSDLQEVDLDVKVTPPEFTSELSQDTVDAQLDAFLSRNAEEEVVLRREVPANLEARCSTYSRASTGSHEKDPRPSIPEKTRTRPESPSHDVPQSNRPVTNRILVDPEDDEDEDLPPVDGYISEEQIQALLNAKESKEKKKTRGLSQLLTIPDAKRKASLPGVVDPPEKWITSRPSYNSLSSVESDEPLPKTNFLSDRRSTGSGSFKSLMKSTESDSSDSQSLSSNVPSDTTSVKHRVSLISPEFTVMEEDGLSSPETSKSKFVVNGGAQERDKIEKDTKAEHKDGKEEQTTPPAPSVAPAPDTDSEAEHEDYFPVVGGDVELRQPAAHLTAHLDSADMRTSGIVGLKEYLKENDKDAEPDVRAGISRLGHSAAVEKLKQTSEDL